VTHKPPGWPAISDIRKIYT